MLKTPTHSKLIWISIASVIGIAIVISLILQQREEHLSQGRNQLFEAQDLMNRDFKGKKISEFQKVDVDAQSPQGVAALKKVAQDYKGSVPGFEAAMALGNLYLNHGVPEKAQEWFGQAGSSAPSFLEKASACLSQGYAFESMGQFNQAVKAFESAQAQGVASLKGDILLALGRAYEGQKDLSKAHSTYDRIVAEMPNTPVAKIAENYRAALP